AADRRVTFTPMRDVQRLLGGWGPHQGRSESRRRSAPGGGTSTSQGHPRTIFRRALEHDNLMLAEVTGREIGRNAPIALLLAHDPHGGFPRRRSYCKASDAVRQEVTLGAGCSSCNRRLTPLICPAASLRAQPTGYLT